ncbi:MAG: NUDIX hydrolase [Chloroflexi bacterium]|nr:NUDIX hydrolase [Chloroflexota bacterium]
MPVKFCAQCGSELVTGSESGRERPMCPRCGYIVYRNPVPVALVVTTRDDKLLLVHRVNAPLAGYWAPPAGYVEIDESLEEGAAREVKEETGFDVVVDKLLRVYSRANVGIMLVTFAAHVVGGEMAPQAHEVAEARFFARDELPAQPPPTDGKPLDYWFYAVAKGILVEFERKG